MYGLWIVRARPDLAKSIERENLFKGIILSNELSRPLLRREINCGERLKLF